MNKLPLLMGLCFVMVGCTSSNKVDPEDEISVISVEPGASSVNPVKKTKMETSVAGQSSLQDAIRSGSDEEVFRIATQILANNPQEPKALMALGMYHYRKGRPQLAMYFYSRVVALKISNSDLHNNIGLVHLAQKEQREAIRAFRKALEQNPQDVNAAGNLSAIYLRNRDFAKAYIVLEMAMKRGNQDVRLLTNFAMAAAAKGKLEQAESLYREVLKLNPNYREGLYNFAVFLIEYQKKMPEGLEILSKLKFLGPAENMRTEIIALENKANAGLK